MIPVNIQLYGVMYHKSAEIKAYLGGFGPQTTSRKFSQPVPLS